MICSISIDGWLYKSKAHFIPKVRVVTLLLLLLLLWLRLWLY